MVREAIAETQLVITGNTVIDALLMAVREDYHFENPILNAIDYSNKRVILLTCHRRENIGAPMTQIFAAIRARSGQSRCGSGLSDAPQSPDCRSSPAVTW